MITPVGKKVFVKQDIQDSEMVNGVYRMDDGLMKRPWEREGVVFAVGHDNPKGLKVGDRVLSRIYTGNHVEVRGETYLVVNQENIAVVIPPEVEEKVYGDGQGHW